MSDKFGKITHETLQSVRIDPLESGLARFISGAGISPLEFIRLPIEQSLDTVRKKQSAREIICDMLIQGNVLPDNILQKIALFAAREALVVFEGIDPEDKRMRRAIEIKERWLAGEAGDDELAFAQADVRAASEVTSGDAALAARAAVWPLSKFVIGDNERAADRLAEKASVRALTGSSIRAAAGAMAGAASNKIGADKYTAWNSAWDSFYGKLYKTLCEIIEESAEAEKTIKKF